MENKFSERFKEQREIKGLNMAEIAKLLNVSKQTISGWERGRQEPNSAMIIKIVKFFEITANYLLGLED